MHIAFMIGSLTKGGAERVMTNLIDFFVQKGHQTTLVTPLQRENEYPLNEKTKRILSDLTEEEIGTGKIRNFVKRFRKLRNIWKTERPDAILVFIGKNNIMTLLTSWGLHIPVVVSVRADPEMEYPGKLMRFLAKFLFRFAKGVVLQTNQCKDFFPRAVQKKAVILHNPVNPEFFKEPYTGEREHTIVTVGRMDENKNQQMILRAFANVLPDHPEYQLILYGTGEDMPKLQALAKELEVDRQVIFAGVTDHIAEKIKRAGVFVLSSDTEGMPNALIEAMALGLPVLSTDCPCGGPADLICHGKNGLLTPVRDVEKMTDNLQNILNNLQNAQRMGEEARKTCEIYRGEIVYQEWFDYIAKIAGRK